MTGIDQLKRWVRNFRVKRKTRHLNGGSSYPCLDAGCGAFPLPIADFVVDLERKSFDIPEMHPRLSGHFVVADIAHLPFADKAFAFVHCSNALEHVDYPVWVLKELQRIGRRGYVETPTWFFDAVLISSPFHRWIVGWKDDDMSLQKPQCRKVFGFQVLPIPIFTWIKQTLRPLWKVIMAVLDYFNLAYSSMKW